MTFYNILFSVLFFSAVRAIFLSVSELNLLNLPMAITVALVVFNDILYTSHSLDQEKARYTAGMKLVDLGNFFLLAVAMVALSPNANLFVSLPVRLHPSPLKAAGLFWLLLTVYWWLALLWNWLSDRAIERVVVREARLANVMWLFPLAAFVVCLWESERAMTIASYVAGVAFAGYVLVYKLLRASDDLGEA